MIVRCAKCGSKNIIVNEKNDGYDLKKGVIGVALLGTGGAVMGVNGKKQMFYHCQECGTTLPYPMSEFTAKKIDEYLNAPALYKSLLDIDKKMYPNIEWENPDLKKITFKTNDDLADALYEYMEKQNIYVLSRKDVDSLFELDRYGIVNSLDACWILEDKGMEYYQDEIDKEIEYYYLIPDNYYKDISNKVLKKIKEKKEVRKSDLRDNFNNYIIQKFVGFTQDEKFLTKISEELLDKITNKKYLMYDNGELYGYVTGDLKYIPYEEEYKVFKKSALDKKKKNADKINNYIMNLIKNDGTKNSVILDKVTPKLLTEKIADNEEEAHFIVNRMLMDKYFEKIIKVDFDKDKSNPIIKLLTSKEKEKLLLEEKNKEKSKKIEAEMKAKEREKLEKKKKEEAEKKQDRRMNDLSLQYFQEIERLLKYEPGQYVASLYKKSDKLKELSPNNLDELSNLMKYLVKVGKCGSFKINGSGAIWYYINDDDIDVEEIKEKRQQEYDDLQNSLNNKTTQSTAKSNGCYVATCVYGSYDCPQVWTLRRFRDNYLENYILGRMFIKLYYAISPTIVKIFGENKKFVSFNKNILDRIILKLKDRGYKDTKYNDKY